MVSLGRVSFPKYCLWIPRTCVPARSLETTRGPFEKTLVQERLCHLAARLTKLPGSNETNPAHESF